MDRETKESNKKFNYRSFFKNNQINCFCKPSAGTVAHSTSKHQLRRRGEAGEGIYFQGLI